jgi:hypothetical protein
MQGAPRLLIQALTYSMNGCEMRVYKQIAIAGLDRQRSRIAVLPRTLTFGVQLEIFRKDFFSMHKVGLAVKGGYLAENGPPKKGPPKTQGSCCRVWNRTTPE